MTGRERPALRLQEEDAPGATAREDVFHEGRGLRIGIASQFYRSEPDHVGPDRQGAQAHRGCGERRTGGADHEEQQPGLAGLDATLASSCRGASYPRSRPDVSRRRRPALIPLFSRAVRTVARNAVRGCGCRWRAARRATPERLPCRKWTWTSSAQSVGGPRAGRDDLPDRPRLGDERDESDVATTPRARKRKLLPRPGHQFGLLRREVS